MSRAVEEWIGKTDDAKIPPRVRLRIFEKHNGICYLSGVKIKPGDEWEAEHIIALCNGGEHRESNLAPALKVPHKLKTKDDMAQKTKNERIRKRNVGIKSQRSITSWRRFDGSIRHAGRAR